MLDRVLTAYRIGDPAGAWPIFDSTGLRLAPGRWNTAASPMIYTSEHDSTAMLEKLVHGNGRMPTNQHWIAITIPPGVAHGFCFSESSIFLYGVSSYWDPADELGCAWNDPAVGIEWPTREPILSARDAQAGSLKDMANKFVSRRLRP